MLTRMRRRSRRFVAVVFAPWFAVVTAEPAAVHHCAMHSPRAAHAQHAGLSELAVAAHQPATHEHNAELGPDASTPERGGAAQCTCDAGCGMTSVATNSQPSAELLVVPETVRREVPLLGATGLAATATPHVLPFANGPPARI